MPQPRVTNTASRPWRRHRKAGFGLGFRAIPAGIVAFGVRLSATPDPPATADGSVCILWVGWHPLHILLILRFCPLGRIL